MRKQNWRLVMVGGVTIAMAIGFFLLMMGFAPQSNDPVALMETVGTVSGVVSGLGIALALFGYIGTKAA